MFKTCLWSSNKDKVGCMWFAGHGLMTPGLNHKKKTFLVNIFKKKKKCLALL